MEGEMSPIGIVYSLEYLSSPSLQRPDERELGPRSRHMERRFSVNTPLLGSQIDKVRNCIEIQVDTFVPEGDDSGSIIGRRDQAVNEIRDMITDAFLAPSATLAPTVT